MATIKTAIQMYNGMTPALKNMSAALNTVISSFEAMQNVSSRAVDMRSLQAARAELNKAEIAFNQIEQEIKQADQAQQKFNNSIHGGQGAASGMLNSLKGWAASIGAVMGLREIVQASDDMASATARLNLMNDKLQTTKELQDMIYQSAQRARGSYLDTVQVVSRLGILAGDAFSSNKEMVAFAEQMNKQFKIGGASLTEQTAAMYQLTQAMASGRLQGDEFRSIRENAPLLAKAIEDYMKAAGVPGTLKDWSSEGLITANVIKNAMFAVADETNERFENLPMTWGQVWTATVNNILHYSQPLLNFINLVANNMDIIGPIVLGVAGAVGIYAVAAYGATAAVKLWTAAQAAFNAVMALNPIALVIMAVVLLIALFYAAVAAVNKFKGTSISATGIIAGAFMAALAFIGNIFIMAGNLIIDVVSTIWNAIANFAEFFANVFNDPIGAVVRLFAGMADTVLSILETIARAIDTVFGSNLAAAVSGWRNGLQGAVSNLVGEAQIKVPRVDTSALHFNRLDLGAAYKAGYKWGVEREDAFKSVKDNLGNIFGGVNDIAGNTGKMADSLEISEEDLKYLRDLAEREVIDRTVLRDVKVSLSNTFGDIRETADVDGIIDKMSERLAQAIANEAEGSFSV